MPPKRGNIAGKISDHSGTRGLKGAFSDTQKQSQKQEESNCSSALL